jgi:hypothetical protein
VAYTLLTPGDQPDMYARLHALVTRHHDDLDAARIALAWCTSWRLDLDGHMVLGKCRRASELDRELQDFDFVILLNREFWQHENTSAIVRDALLEESSVRASRSSAARRRRAPTRFGPSTTDARTRAAKISDGDSWSRPAARRSRSAPPMSGSTTSGTGPRRSWTWSRTPKARRRRRERSGRRRSRRGARKMSVR